MSCLRFCLCCRRPPSTTLRPDLEKEKEGAHRLPRERQAVSERNDDTLHNMAATTPVRPVPGAFLNTPAPAPADPVRRDLFGAAVTGGPRRGPLGTSPPRQPAMNRFPPPAARPGSPPRPVGPPAPLPAAQTAADNTPPAQKAARFVNELLQLDASYPDIDSYCRRELFPCPSVLSDL